MNLVENVERKKGFEQVCVWPGTLIKENEIKDFEEWILNEFKTRAQYLETIETEPDIKNGKITEGTGGRHDVFFAIHKEDVGKFSIPRLSVGIRWVEDVLAKGNYKNKIYPKRVFKYKTWEG
jgi:hypothetical protein